MTYFRAVYPALSSARRRFTVLFGMGRGGASGLWSSDVELRPRSVVVVLGGRREEGAGGVCLAAAGGRGGAVLWSQAARAISTG